MRLAALMLLLGLAAFAGFLLLHSRTSYDVQDREQISSGPSAVHWMGTDALGRDHAVRLSAALLLGLLGAVSASAVAASIAVGVGVTAAFAPRCLAAFLLYASDLFLTVPWLFLLMIVRSALPLTMTPLASAAITFALLALSGWPAYARVTYGGALAIRDAGWMVHGRAMGLPTPRLLRRYLLPHLLPLLTAQFLVCIPACIIAEANLGALGLGISEPLPSWGSMLLELQHSALVATSGWIYLPVALLVGVLLLLELLAPEVIR